MICRQWSQETVRAWFPLHARVPETFATRRVSDHSKQRVDVVMHV